MHQRLKSTSSAVNLKNHHDSFKCQCKHSLSSENNHCLCHQSVTAGHLTNQLKTTSYNQASLNHNTQREPNKLPSQPLIRQSSHHTPCCSRREWRLHPLSLTSQHWGLINAEQKQSNASTATVLKTATVFHCSACEQNSLVFVLMLR